VYQIFKISPPTLGGGLIAARGASDHAFWIIFQVLERKNEQNVRACNSYTRDQTEPYHMSSMHPNMASN